jgi:hypothetical protein
MEWATGWSVLEDICDGGGPLANATKILSTDIVEARGVTFGCGNDVLAVLMSVRVVDADATDVGNGWTELFPDVSKDDMITPEVSGWTLEEAV